MAFKETAPEWADYHAFRKAQVRKSDYHFKFGMEHSEGKKSAFLIHDYPESDVKYTALIWYCPEEHLAGIYHDEPGTDDGFVKIPVDSEDEALARLNGYMNEKMSDGYIQDDFSDCPTKNKYYGYLEQESMKKSGSVKKDYDPVDFSETKTILIGIQSACEALEYCKDMCDTIMELDIESSSKPEDLVEETMHNGLKDDIRNIEKAVIDLREKIYKIYTE